MMCIRDMVSEVRDMHLERSLTARIGISRHGEPAKALSYHRSCSTPLWKFALFMLGVIVGLMTVCCIIKKADATKMTNE